MNIFSWDNFIIIVVSMLIGLFAGLGMIQINAGNLRVVTIILIISLSFLGLAVGFAFVLKKMLVRSKYEIEILRSANRSKDEFISMLLHFIRTPLTGIRWSLKSLLDEEPKNFPREELNKLYQADVLALKAVEHLLDVARASLERIEYDFKIISVKTFQELVNNTINQFAPEIRKKGLDLRVNFSSPSDYSLRIDQAKILNVIQSLLQNAIDYTDKGSITVEITEGKRDIFFSITDTGIGIPQEDWPKIFLQFFRSENARYKVPSGFGCGLYLSKVFIEKHGGKIWFKSEEGKGTTFTFSLPLIISKTEETLQRIS